MLSCAIDRSKMDLSGRIAKMTGSIGDLSTFFPFFPTKNPSLARCRHEIVTDNDESRYFAEAIEFASSGICLRHDRNQLETDELQQ